MAHTTWDSMVLPGDIDGRACVFCGGHVAGVKKVMGTEDLQEVLERQKEHLHADLLHRTTHNMCSANAAASALEEVKAIFSCCYCCHHWVDRKKRARTFMLPLQALRWHLNTLHRTTKKTFDSRVVLRLSRALVHPGGAARGGSNYYLSLFTPPEQALLREIVETPVEAIPDAISRFYFKQNGSPLFLTSAKSAESVRASMRGGRDTMA